MSGIPNIEYEDAPDIIVFFGYGLQENCELFLEAMPMHTLRFGSRTSPDSDSS